MLLPLPVAKKRGVKTTPRVCSGHVRGSTAQNLGENPREIIKTKRKRDKEKKKKKKLGLKKRQRRQSTVAVRFEWNPGKRDHHHKKKNGGGGKRRERLGGIVKVAKRKQRKGETELFA